MKKLKQLLSSDKIAIACAIVLIISGTLSLFNVLPTYANISSLPKDIYNIRPFIVFNTVSMYALLAFILLNGITIIMKESFFYKKLTRT